MANKRDLVLGKKKVSRTSLFIISGMLLLMIIAIFSFINTKPVASPLPYATEVAPQQYQGTKINQTLVDSTVANGVIQIPLQQVLDQKFILTRYIRGGKTVPLTTYIAPSGKVISAVSICEPCQSESFHIDGTLLVCNACGTRWELETLIGISGGCQDFPPDVLESTLVDGNITISESLVANWQPRI